MFHESISQFRPDLAANRELPDSENRRKSASRKHSQHETLSWKIAKAKCDESADGDESLPLWVMKITQPALSQTMNYLVNHEPETAGILLGPANDDSLVTHFVPDRTGRGTSASFELGTAELNDVLKRMKPAGINCKGIAHSHPAGISAPSHGDLAYLRRLFSLGANADATQFFMPIVCGGRLHPYIYIQDRVWHAELVVI